MLSTAQPKQRNTHHEISLRFCSQMPTIFVGIFLVYNLLNSILLCLVPKKLRFLLPSSWYPQQARILDNKTALLLSPLSLSILDNEKKIAQHFEPSKTVSPLVSSPLPSSIPSLESSLFVQKKMDSIELKRIFEMFDENGDGRITKKELNDSLEKLGIPIPDKDLAQMIEKIDVNGDGCVDIDEFGSLYQQIMGEQQEEEEEDMKEAFNVFDQNGDGYITVDELRSVLGSLGLKQGRTLEDCKTMILNVDVDGDGMVNYKEFKQMMKGGGFNDLS